MKDFLKSWVAFSTFVLVINVLFGWNAIDYLGLVGGFMFSIGCGMVWAVWKDLYRGWVGE